MTTSLLNDGYATERKGEEWASIPGYEGIYEASTHGRIRSSAGKVTTSARFPRREWKQREIRQKWQNRNGSELKDARVSLWKDGKESTQLVARLVALTFVPGYAEGLTVNHVDGNPSNNQVSNLEWCTRADNIRKAFVTGQYSNQRSITLICDGVETVYRSMAEASRALHRSIPYVSNAIKRGNAITDASGKVYQVKE